MDFSYSTDKNCSSESEILTADFLVYDYVSVGQSYSKSLDDKLLWAEIAQNEQFLCLVMLQFLVARFKLNTKLKYQNLDCKYLLFLKQTKNPNRILI